MSLDFVYLTETQIQSLLSWPLVYEAVEQSFRSICEVRSSESQPTAHQPTRTLTKPPNGSGILFTMPGFIGNYRLTADGVSSKDNNKIFNTLGCKLVTSFSNNNRLNPPKPNIMANILLFNDTTGELKAILQATEITAWRTAAASLVATEYLFFKRPSVQSKSENNSINAAIIGSGVQGRIHAIGLCSLYSLSSIVLWNRTKSHVQVLCEELNNMRKQFRNPNVHIQCADTVEDCVRNADVIVTATFASSPILVRSMIKDNVHINAVGAGENHHSELSLDIYKDARTQIYIDNWGSARTELKTLDAPIIGEVGDIINGTSVGPSSGITIFHSMGMAVEDAAVGQAILEKYQNNGSSK